LPSSFLNGSIGPTTTNDARPSSVASSTQTALFSRNCDVTRSVDVGCDGVSGSRSGEQRKIREKRLQKSKKSGDLASFFFSLSLVRLPLPLSPFFPLPKGSSQNLLLPRYRERGEVDADSLVFSMRVESNSPREKPDTLLAETLSLPVAKQKPLFSELSGELKSESASERAAATAGRRRTSLFFERAAS